MILILVEFGLRPGAEAPPCRDHRCRRSGIFVPHGRLIFGETSLAGWSQRTCYRTARKVISYKLKDRNVHTRKN